MPPWRHKLSWKLVAECGCSSISVFAQSVAPAAREPDEIVTLPEFAVTTALPDNIKNVFDKEWWTVPGRQEV